MDDFVSVIKAEEAKNLHVPAYEGLTVEAILDIGQQHAEVRRHLPDERDIRRLPRQWIINVVYSLIGDSFRNWVSTLVRTRND